MAAQRGWHGVAQVEEGGGQALPSLLYPASCCASRKGEREGRKEKGKRKREEREKVGQGIGGIRGDGRSVCRGFGRK